MTEQGSFPLWASVYKEENTDFSGFCSAFGTQSISPFHTYRVAGTGQGRGGGDGDTVLVLVELTAWRATQTLTKDSHGKAHDDCDM